MSWKELLPHVTYRVRARRPIADSETRVISQLYVPIMQSHAYSLYMTMYHQLSPEHWYSGEFSHRYLVQTLGIDMIQLVRAREQLEGIGLLSTYRLKGAETLEYYLQPPLTPFEFFQSDVLAYLLLNRIGQESYRQLYSKYSLPLELRYADDVERIELTKEFAQVYAGIKWNEVVPQRESESKKIVTELLAKAPLPVVVSRWKDGQVPDFIVDFDYLLASFAKEHHAVLFSEQNRHLIKMYAFLYNVETERLGMILNDSYDKVERVWDLNRFIELAKRSFRAQSIHTIGGEHVQATQQENREAKLHRFKTSSPYILLRDYQGGGQVSNADERLVDDLLHKVGLHSEVVNVLLDFVMLMKENQLPREYTMKIASSWKRRGFQSAEDAFMYAAKEYDRKDPNRVYFQNKRRKKVPEYIWLQVERDRQEEKEIEQQQIKSDTDIAEVERIIADMKKTR